ncbi:unnamed protein product [Trifolium pratense]|uniref:Uncharacterized protein n=1 Tax=Trifolium pratense TaxID=57577 RepID=A0ACB0LMV5_TRIPR|nr:unnamed protein product [Trifolium pratense]
MIKRMVRWNIIPQTCVPDSCIVNIYDVGDCIPPHIDHHDFVRPFYSVSFLSEAKILFGSNLKAIRPGEFSGPASISLPVGSVFVLKGNGADIAKHCVPSVSSKRISITFRKMDERKLPYNFSPDPELVGIKPLINSPPKKPERNSETQIEKDQSFDQFEYNPVWKTRKESLRVKDEYPLPINGSFRRMRGNEVRHRTRY